MKIPRTLIREVANQVVMFLNSLGMEASQTAKIVNCKMKNEDLPACGRKEKRKLKDCAICNLKVCILHRRSAISRLANPV